MRNKWAVSLHVRPLDRDLDYRLGLGLSVLALGALLIFWRTIQFDPLGDEPHYLVLAHSIVHDGDFDVSQNYRRDTYGNFYHAELDPHLFALDHRRSMHDPTVSLIVAAPYRLFGREGATALVLILNLIAAALSFRVLLTLGLGETLSVGVVLAFFFASPWGTMASQVYPDSIALAGYAILTHILFVARPNWRSGGLAGFVLALLWDLHVKLSPAAIVFGLAMVILQRSRAFAVACVFTAAVFTGAHSLLLHRLYSSWLLWIPVTDDLMPRPDAIEYIHTAAMYLFDAQYGLVPQAPGWLLALPGVVGLACSRSADRDCRPLNLDGWKQWGLWICAGTALVHFGTVSTWRWIGWSTSARYLAPAVPLLLPLAGLGAKILTASRRGRAMCWLLLGFQVLWFIVLNVQWNARYDARGFLAARIGIERNQVPYFIDVLEPQAPAHPYAWWVAVFYLALGGGAISLSLDGASGRGSPLRPNRATYNSP